MRATAYFFASLEQAGLLVTAIQFGRSDVTTLARTCQSIKADWRRRGVGAALLTAALDLASRRDFIRIELDVHADNAAAIALYEKFGFVREGVQCDGALIDGRFVDVVLMGPIDRVAGGRRRG